LLAIACGPPSAAGHAPAGAAESEAPVVLRPVSREQLKVTEGTVAALPSGELSIEDAKVRAVVAATRGDAAELRFRFLGPSTTIAPLDGGEARQQLGLKLRAADGCNVVYVMWRIEPRSALAISVKRNPGQSRSAQCGTRGYRILPLTVSLPRLSPGASHVLRADLHRDELAVHIDEVEVWRGQLGEEVGAMAGPAGIRTDNVRVAFQLAAGAP